MEKASAPSNLDRAFADRQVTASIACTRTSSPDDTVTLFGQDKRKSGSSTAKKQGTFFPFMPSFVLDLVSTKEAVLVTSLPVPAVVGIKTTGRGAF